jgi:integrase
MNLIRKTDINWQARQVRIRQGKTGNYKAMGPLGRTSMEILREFYDASKADLAFSRSGNISPKFYRILREACERAGVPYGRGTRDGLIGKFLISGRKEMANGKCRASLVTVSSCLKVSRFAK